LVDQAGRPGPVTGIDVGAVEVRTTAGNREADAMIELVNSLANEANWRWMRVKVREDGEVIAVVLQPPSPEHSWTPFLFLVCY